MKKLFIFTTSLFFFGALNLKAQIKFELAQLPFSYESLEPHIDKETMMIHHTKHHQGYINNLKTALAGKEEPISLDDLMKNVSKYSVAVRNNGGGHYNHSLFWSILTPSTTKPSKRLQEAIDSQFGGMDSLKTLLNNAAMKQFGSGWAWLCVDENKKLFITSTANQDNPLMDVVDKKGTPIIGIDVWEHAYYLKYQNKRADYLSSIWKVLNWDEISRRYDVLVPKGKFDDWQELKDFHKVMSQTFHPSEKGDLQPIKQRSQELVIAAEKLSKSKIPAEFDNKNVRDALKKLNVDSKKLHKMVQNKKSDSSITKALNDLHDVFHRIVGLCSNEED